MPSPNVHIDMSAQGVKAKPPLTPEEIAQRNAAKTARIGVKSGVYASLVFAAVGFLYLTLALLSVVNSAGDVLRALLLSIAYTLVSFGLPVMALLAGIISAKESGWIWNAWIYGTLAVGGFAFISYASSSLPSGAVRPAKEIEADLRYLPPAELAVWHASSQCQAPAPRQQATCAAILAKREPLLAEWRVATGQSNGFSVRDWVPSNDSPSRWASTAAPGGEDIVNRLLMLLLSLAALPASGMIMRWAAMADAGSHQLAAGTVSLAQPGRAAPVALIEDGSSMTPEGFWSEWFDCRLTERTGSKVGGEEAYLDYVQACEINGREPMSITAFGNLMTKYASTSKGRVIKSISSGRTFYRGLSLGEREQEFAVTTAEGVPLLK
jgi:hypothetical protein